MLIIHIINNLNHRRITMISELKTFVAVVELKNFTKAAQALNMSQPSVSIHIKNLENMFQTTLINRSVKQKKIIITDNGYKLYTRAKEILDLIDLANYELTTESTTLKGSLRIGSSLTIGEYLLPEFLTYFSKKYPEVYIELVMQNTSKICSGIHALSYDVGFVEGLPLSGNVTQHCFYEDQMVLAYPSSYPSINEISDLSSIHWISREDGSGTREYLNIYLSQNQIQPEKMIVLGSNYAVTQAIKRDLGITVISKLVVEEAKKRGELNIHELGESFTRQFSYIIPKNITPTTITKIFLHELEEFYKIEVPH